MALEGNVNNEHKLRKYLRNCQGTYYSVLSEMKGRWRLTGGKAVQINN